jgi:hypothetical protein
VIEDDQPYGGFAGYAMFAVLLFCVVAIVVILNDIVLYAVLKHELPGMLSNALSGGMDKLTTDLLG